MSRRPASHHSAGRVDQRMFTNDPLVNEVLLIRLRTHRAGLHKEMVGHGIMRNPDVFLSVLVTG